MERRVLPLAQRSTARLKPILDLPVLTTAVFLGALSAAALWLGNGLPYHNDILVYVYPERAFNLECLRQGLLPLWNPYLGCGTPHLANWQSGFFYPPYWLTAWTGVSRGLVDLALLHEAWAFAGFYLWARSQKNGAGASALAAFSFAGCAHFVRCWVNLPFIATASWIPWVFLTVHLSLEDRRPWRSLLAVSALALQLAAGYPIFVFYTWVTLAGWLLLRGLPLKGWGKVFLLLSGALLLTCVQWLPFLEFLSCASHGDWRSFPYRLHPWELLTLFWPTVLGVPGASSYRSDPTNSLFGCLYFGLVPGLLWLGSLAWKKSRPDFWPVFSLLLLLWMGVPGLLLFGWIPSSWFDFLEPSKAVGLFVFCACTSVCAFVGHGPVSSGPAGRWSWLKTALAALWLLDLAVLPFRLTYRVPDPFADGSLRSGSRRIMAASQGKRVLALQNAGGLSFQVPRVDPSSLEGLSRLFAENFLPNTNMVWGFRSPTAYFSLQTDGLKDLFRYLNRGFPYDGDLLDVAGVGAFCLPQTLTAPKYRPAGKVGGNELCLDPEASEDMRWVGGTSEWPGRPAILDALSGAGNPWREKVYLEKNGGGALAGLAPMDGPRAFPPVQAYSRPGAGRAGRFISSPRPGYLVFDESCMPGWHAWVDGRPQPILRAYGLFMTAAVPSGAHQVDFRYEPVSFRLGLFVSLAALGMVLALLFSSEKGKPFNRR